MIVSRMDRDFLETGVRSAHLTTSWRKDRIAKRLLTHKSLFLIFHFKADRKPRVAALPTDGPINHAGDVEWTLYKG